MYMHMYMHTYVKEMYCLLTLSNVACVNWMCYHLILKLLFLFMYVCMYVCMYVRMYVCMYVCTYIQCSVLRAPSGHMTLSGAVWYVNYTIHIHIKCMYVRTYVCMYVCMYVCTYVCMYVSMYVCMHVFMYVCRLTKLNIVNGKHLKCVRARELHGSRELHMRSALARVYLLLCMQGPLEATVHHGPARYFCMCWRDVTHGTMTTTLTFNFGSRSSKFHGAKGKV